ncbi:DUF2264 domain-containing protein [Uliginosibacterium sp. sgz301328]|uniref:DUF2264 domain-containing protein n=1 Tax=Uliginosibacterium sp. sgz301328 TaxID=3243764 RepID=UPI00359D2BE5
MMATADFPFDVTKALDREALVKLLDWVIDKHLPCFTPGNAGLRIAPAGASFDQSAADLEGFARLLWGVAPAMGGRCEVLHFERFVDGLSNGVDPLHPAYWGEAQNADQRVVEMAAIATLIQESPAFIDQMSAGARQNLCCWLARVQHIELPPNNWRFFRVLVLKALQRMDFTIDTVLLEEELDFIDSQYILAGWYGDGAKACTDYYNGFAFQYYGLLYARWHMHDDPVRSQRFVARAQEFANTYRYWFAESGAHIAYGRSLLYRFAPAGFWALLACFGHPEISMGELRGLWSRSLTWWLDKPCFDAAGHITLGYAYPSQLITEFYNSAQSPLWMLKAFFPLALPADHPFWKASPVGQSFPDVGYVQSALRQCVQRKQGEAYLLSGAPAQNEIRHSADKYLKFAYSTAHGLCVESTRWLSSGFVGDNLLAFSADKENWFFRTRLIESSLQGDELRTVWSPFPGCLVRTCQRFIEGGESRFHDIENDSPLDFVASGHSVDLWCKANRSFDVVMARVPRQEVLATGTQLYSAIRESSGRYHHGLMPCTPNTNLMFPYAAVPVVFGSLSKGHHRLETTLRYGRNEFAHCPA